MQDSHTI